MTDRIKQLIAYYHLTPATFADRIDVSRPVISHILMGRNKPSLEVVQKIGRAFKEVSTDWLLYGKGDLKSAGLASETENENSPGKTQPENKTEPQVVSSDVTYKVQKSPDAGSNLQVRNTTSPKIIRVLFFYDDATFSEFKPAE